MHADSVSAQRHIEKMLSGYNAQSLADLPKEIRSRIRSEAREIALKDVFGADHKKDNQGNPIEQGVGSHENPTRQSIEAFVTEQTTRRIGGPEPGYEKTLEKMRKRLAEVEARRQRTEKASDEDDL